MAAAVVAVTWSSIPAQAASAQPPCPASQTLTPGDQDSATSAVLYCGGTLTDTWNGSGQSDWIAFYTTVDNASVTAHYAATAAAPGDVDYGCPGYCGVTGTLYDQGSPPGTINPVSDGGTSADTQDPDGVTYTFPTAGLQYLNITPCANCAAENTGYTVSLNGQWSQTPPPSSGPIQVWNLNPQCPASATLTPGAQGSGQWAPLYCGGTLTDTWNGSGQSDWIAFYTTVDNASVTAHYTATAAPPGTTGGCTGYCPVVGYLYDQGSPPGTINQVSSGGASDDTEDPDGVTYTFPTAGLHYLNIAPCAAFCAAENTGYTLYLNGQWSQTPPGPTVRSISPRAGAAKGGTVVTVRGTNFAGVTAVYFGKRVASHLVIISSTELKATAPAGSGTVDVTVKTPAGQTVHTAADRFTYYLTPAVTSISPTSGPAKGGNVVTIKGKNLLGATSVRFGSKLARIKSVTATQIEVVAPPGEKSATVTVTVTTPGGTSATTKSTRYKYT